MIFYIILLCLHACHCVTVTRDELFDFAKGEVVCRNTCTCRSPTATFFHLPEDGKCRSANETGCSLNVDGYTNDVPLITQSMLNKREFRITKDGGNLCPNTFEASSVRMLALTDSWEVVPTFMSNLFSYSIPNVKEVNVTFHTVWSGLLIKLEVKCKASNGNEYTPRENCVLFKYEGTATYPLTLSSFAPVSSTTPEPTVSKIATTTTATTTTTTTTTIPTTTKASTETNTNFKKSTKVTHASLETTTPVTNYSETSIPLSPTTGTSKDHNNNRDIAMAAAIAATVILILVTIIIILICYKKKLDRRSSKRKVAYTKTNIDENIYDKVNKKEEDKKKGENEVIEFPNITYGNKINLYAKVRDESDEQKIQKQDSHYYNTNDINKNSNYYNVFGEKEASHVDNKPVNATNVSHYDQIWSNNDEDKKNVESRKTDHGDDNSNQDDVDDEENTYIVTGGLNHNI
ncbi:uncharacterized protein LOC130625151 isoform X2 [Hydractinia symbiolongicarpus]|uniref:uncharacterized protein LOC130625151 isoform X2 n=1 Tax=Hydractinia symbiolongicarpus TaxID=13093 RepID=UPI00254D1611|nr:uncharacterized protein LOC130625151 isoform X2 [Hydractinia symbiolongicarpus]